MSWQTETNKEILKELAERIRAIRIRKRYTQKDLAEKSGVSIYSIQQIEQGKSVSLHIFLSVLRSLRLLNGLSSAFPDSSISPIALLEQNKPVAKRVRKTGD